MGILEKDKHTFKTKSTFQNEYVDRITKGILWSIASFLRVVSFKKKYGRDRHSTHYIIIHECDLHAG